MRAISLCLIALAVLAFTSCADPEPAEIGVSCTLNGKPHGCVIVLLNSKGIQIQQQDTDYKGIVYLKQVPPGSYTMKFKGTNDQYYPAVREIEVAGGDSAVVKVELNDESESAS